MSSAITLTGTATGPAGGGAGTSTVNLLTVPAGKRFVGNFQMKLGGASGSDTVLKIDNYVVAQTSGAALDAKSDKPLVLKPGSKIDLVIDEDSPALTTSYLITGFQEDDA